MIRCKILQAEASHPLRPNQPFKSGRFKLQVTMGIRSPCHNSIGCQPEPSSRHELHTTYGLAVRNVDLDSGKCLASQSMHPIQRHSRHFAFVQYFQEYPSASSSTACFSPYHGIRVGEAKNPGPRVTMGIINPTAMTKCCFQRPVPQCRRNAP